MGPRKMRTGSGKGSTIRNIIVCIRLRLPWHIARMEESRSAFKILPTGKIPLGRPTHKGQDNYN